MKICPVCRKTYDVGNFCEVCENPDGSGVKLVEAVKCSSCGEYAPQGLKRCTSCGVPFAAKSAGGFSMGDKNVIAGDVINTTNHNETIVDNTVIHNETYNTTTNHINNTTHNNTTNNTTNNNTTNIINQDETKKMMQCHVCGKHIVITQTFTCRKCGLPTCIDCYNENEKTCLKCSTVQVKAKDASDAVKQFAEKLVQADTEIANEPETKKKKEWWTGWKGIAKFGYVILNIYTFGIPLIFHLLGVVFKAVIPSFGKGSLSPAEKKKKSIVDNLIVPNKKEDIIELLSIAQLQRENALTTKTRTSNIWLNIWITKTNQIITKAKQWFAGDTAFISYLDDQHAECAKLRKSLKTKSLIPLAVVVGIIVAGILAIIIGTKAGVPKVPEVVKVPAENVRILGYFEEYAKVTDDGLTLRFRPSDDNKVEITFNLEGKANGAVLINKEIDKAIANKKWNKADVTYEVYDYADLRINGEDASDMTGERWSSRAKKSLANFYALRNGEVVKFDVTVKPGSSALTKKGALKLVNEYMNSSYWEINPQVEYKIKNNATNDTYYLKFNEIK